MQDRLHIRAATHADGLALLAQRRPAVRSPVPPRISWVQGLDVQILLVEAENGEAPRNGLVVAGGDAGQCRLDRTDDVPTGCDQVNDVAQRRLGDHPVRIVGE